jgi:hypothetical protein
MYNLVSTAISLGVQHLRLFGGASKRVQLSSIASKKLLFVQNITIVSFQWCGVLIIVAVHTAFVLCSEIQRDPSLEQFVISHDEIWRTILSL